MGNSKEWVYAQVYWWLYADVCVDVCMAICVVIRVAVCVKTDALGEIEWKTSIYGACVS